MAGRLSRCAGRCRRGMAPRDGARGGTGPEGGSMGLKVAVVGGGSTYTPELVEGLGARSQRLPIDELALLDVDAERLEVVGSLVRRMLDRVAWRGRVATTSDADAALDGADIVLVQLRVGGQAARLVDETLPPPL